MSIGCCECGCGGQTNVASNSNAKLGHVKGVPFRYIAGHQRRKSPVEYIVDDAGCWVWQRSCGHHGYGQVRVAGRLCLAHRVAWEKVNGAVPPGLDLDHLCRNRACVNPDHLEPVTRAENARRGAKARLTHDAVRYIKARPWAAQEALAERFDVSTRAIRGIRNGETWVGV